MNNPSDLKDEAEKDEDKNQGYDDDGGPQELGLAFPTDQVGARHQQVGLIGSVHFQKVKTKVTSKTKFMDS